MDHIYWNWLLGFLLVLQSVAVVVLLHAERRVLNVSIIVLVGFLVFAAWQFGATMRSPSSLLVGGAGSFVHLAGIEIR
ncbi:hypothetical protein VQV38_001765 [Raoultella planticola]|nr:hypothetical protein [Raoultella planticola]OWP40893.1 hypothetical protein CEG93_15625 [Raoultella ornithinolytica]